MTFKADKFSLETEPVASGDNMIFMLKPDDQTFIMSYSTVNRSMKQDTCSVGGWSNNFPWMPWILDAW